MLQGIHVEVFYVSGAVLILAVGIFSWFLGPAIKKDIEWYKDQEEKKRNNQEINSDKKVKQGQYVKTNTVFSINMVFYYIKM